MKTRRSITLLILSVISISLIILSWLDLNYAYGLDRMSAFIGEETFKPTSISFISSHHNYVLYGMTVFIITVTLISSIRYRRMRK